MPSVGTLHVTASLASVLVPLRARPLPSPHCATPQATHRQQHRQQQQARTEGGDDGMSHFCKGV